jgi:hypothetical protein
VAPRGIFQAVWWHKKAFWPAFVPLAAPPARGHPAETPRAGNFLGFSGRFKKGAATPEKSFWQKLSILIFGIEQSPGKMNVQAENRFRFVVRADACACPLPTRSVNRACEPRRGGFARRTIS